ncbi:MAG: cytochrome c3 family protein [Gammaproteobacteria bacterium]|nr:cytochrome c3 family protein [Gammaproteobacteria bacterium]
MHSVLYGQDGQIKQEDYVYGSFIQSKMYHQGVTCSDCHEPHSLKLRAEGNGVCLQCHAATKFNRSSHHFHDENGLGAGCAVRYAYVYAVALNSEGQSDKAITLLKQILQSHPSDTDSFIALITFYKNQGDIKSATMYANKLLESHPEFGTAQQILEAL